MSPKVREKEAHNMCKALKLGLLAFAVLGMTFLGCDKLANPIVEQPPDEPGRVTTSAYNYVTDILAGQSIDVGDIGISFTWDYIYVEYTVTAPWYLTEVHVQVATTLEGIPHNDNSGMIPGQFFYNREFDEYKSTWLVAYPNTDEFRDASDLYVAAHCALVKIEDDTIVQEETGWGEGDPYPGHNWGMYIHFGTPPHDPPVPKVLHLPSGVISSRFSYITNDPVLGGGIPSQFELKNVPGSYDIWNGYWSSFCLDHGIYIYNQWYNNTHVWSSYDLSMPSYARYIRGTYPPGVPVPYDRINYLLNKVIFGWNYTADPLPFTTANILALQHCFWYYRGNLTYNQLSTAEKALVDDAAINGVGFYPSSGQYMAVLMDNGTSVQLCFIVVDP